MRWLWMGLALVGAWGCDDAASPDPLDESVEADGGVADAGGAGDMQADAVAVDMTPADAALDMGPSDLGPDAVVVECPEDEPVLRTVRFRVNNPSDSPRYLPIRGDLCELFRVNNALGSRIANRVVNICTAECACIAGTPESWATAYLRLDPGATHEVTWAAQQVERCEREVHCPEFEGRGRPSRFDVATPVRRNLQPNGFAVVLAFESELPAGCVDDGSPEIECMGPIGQTWFDLCEASDVFEVPFELTVEDETVVEVDLP